MITTTSKKLKLVLSYSFKDNVLVQRVYNDLRRAGINVWCYEADGKAAASFMSEFLLELEASDYMIFFDSAAARKSTYIPLEIEAALSLVAQKQRFKNLFIVLCEPIFDTKSGKDFRQAAFGRGRWKPLEEQISLRRAFELFDFDVFDQFDKYDRELTSLLAKLNVEYHPLNKSPRGQDFNKEVMLTRQAEEQHKTYLPNNGFNSLDREVREIFAKTYQLWDAARFRKSKSAIKILEGLIEVIGEYKCSSITAELARAIWYSRQSNHVKSEEYFKEITVRFDADPRGWHGLAAAKFFRRKYEDALNDYYQTLMLLDQHHERKKHQAWRHEVHHNIARCYLALKKPPAALSQLDFIPIETQEIPEILALRICISIAVEDSNKVDELYQKLKPTLKQFEQNENWLNVLLANAVGEMSQFATDQGQLKKAIELLHQCIQLCPDNLQYYADLALIYSAQNDTKMLYEIADNVLVKPPKLPGDEYALGQVHFLLGNIETADFYATRSGLAEEFGDYSTLIY